VGLLARLVPVAGAIDGQVLDARRADVSPEELAALTSFETYLELRRHAGLSKKDVVAKLQRMARLSSSA
jgi:hypothetical protein